ncbi:MAG: hypothetical protein ACOYIP_01785 [Coriobacteriales bacterium]
MEKRISWLKVMLAAALCAFVIACMPAIALAEDEAATDAEPGVAKADDYGEREEVGADNLVPITPDMLPDGTYDLTADTDSSMFKITKCEVTVANGEMTAVFTLGGTGYERLYRGEGKDALKADASEYAEAVEDADGAYTYTMSIPAINYRMDVSAFSKRKQLWYDHTVVIDPAGLPEGTIMMGAYAPEAGDPFKAKSAYTKLEDGIYTMEVELAGGTGKASITSPAYVKVEDGHPVVSLEWSSQNYDYMILNGEKYLPVERDKKNYFELPIMVFDEPMDVIADTTAMSQPHEIAYQLTFKEDTAVNASQGIHVPSKVVFLVIVVFAAVILLLFRSRMRSASGKARR